MVLWAPVQMGMCIVIAADRCSGPNLLGRPVLMCVAVGKASVCMHVRVYMAASISIAIVSMTRRGKESQQAQQN